MVSLFDDRLKSYFGVNYTNNWNWNKAPDPAPPDVNQGDRTKVGYRGVASFLPGITFVAGAEHETEMLQTVRVNAEQSNSAGYAEIQAEYDRRFFLVLNGRFDDNDNFGGHTTFRLAPAVIVPLTETKLKGSYGTGFKAPTLTQLFVDFPEFNFFANPNLKPEESKGFDVGFEQPVFNDRLRFGATYFHNDITDLINTFFDPIRLRSTLINTDQATTDGLEAFASVVLNEKVKVRADYTYTSALDAKTGQQLLRRPRNKASMSVIWSPIEGLTISTTALFVDKWTDVDRATFARITQPGFIVVNVAANYTRGCPALC